MKRTARLQSAAHWIPTYEGKNIVRGHDKWFGVDLGCALEELQLLGVELDPEYVERLRTTLRNRNKPPREPAPTELDSPPSHTDWNDDFAFIAGYTPNGAPFGITWEQQEVIEAGADQLDVVLIDDGLSPTAPRFRRGSRAHEKDPRR